jgi:hypothetical protein
MLLGVDGLLCAYSLQLAYVRMKEVHQARVQWAHFAGV